MDTFQLFLIKTLGGVGNRGVVVLYNGQNVPPMSSCVPVAAAFLYLIRYSVLFFFFWFSPCFAADIISFFPYHEKSFFSAYTSTSIGYLHLT